MLRPRIGVLAVQGDVSEHLAVLEHCGATGTTVRRPEELGRVQGLVIPGGESTAMDKLVRAFGLREPLVAAVRSGLPVYGACAGMIMLADRVLDGRPDQQTLGGLDVAVRRNAFGRQVDSFEDDLTVEGVTEPERPVRAVFIRAPWVEEVGAGVTVLARMRGGGADGRAVAVRQGSVLATSFHPELTGDERVHAAFVEMVRGG